ncbi:ABC transporter substrate-binding protein [Shinella zoogloeoides]|uniref:ABC transporter substrate-binding protein n=1 Tax=Shinella zoogloeoides TaxID=352475 RepID=UPI0028AF4C2D|nr:ABC transporter substrate-binding protein [Shinella zoogloeoides]
MFHFRKVFFAATLIAGSYAGTAAHSAELNVICSHDVKWCEYLAQKFEEKTGIKVNAVRLSAGEAFARIRAEARNPKTDALYSGPGDTYFAASREGLLDVYKSPLLGDLHPWAQRQAEITQYQSVAWSSSAIGFVYNPEILEKKGLTPPACWADLVKPEYKGEVQIANPNSAGTAAFTLSLLVQFMGEDAAFEYQKKLNENISSYSKSGTAPAKAVSRGEIGIAVAFLADVQPLIDEGFPIKAVYPCEGTSLSGHGIGIVKGAKNLDEARQWIDWVLSPEVQSAASGEGVYVVPANSKATVSDKITALMPTQVFEYDIEKFGPAEMRAHLLKRWTDEIGANAQ